MERTCELIKQAKEGNKEAQSILVEENSGLIWSVVKRFQGRGYDKEDLFPERGNADRLCHQCVCQHDSHICGGVCGTHCLGLWNERAGTVISAHHYDCGVSARTWNRASDVSAYRIFP